MPLIEEIISLLRKGMPKAAIARCNESIEADDPYKRAEALRARAHIWNETGEMPQALGDLEEANRILPRSAETLARLARVYYESGKYPDAIIASAKLLQVELETVTGYFRDESLFISSCSHLALGDYFSAASIAEEITDNGSTWLGRPISKQELLSEIRKRAGDG